MNSHTAKTSALSLFRVYSPFKPAVALKLFAHGADEAKELAKAKNATLARFNNLRAVAA